MRKQVALLGAVALLSGTLLASQAEAFSFKSLLSKAKAAVHGAVNNALNKVKSAVPGLAAKAQGLANKGIGALGSLVQNTIARFGTMAQGMVTKGGTALQNWVRTRGEALAKQLPGVLGRWVRQGSQIGAGGIGKFQQMLNSKIRMIMGRGNKLVSAGVAKGRTFVSNFLTSLTGRINKGIETVRGIAHGKIRRASGQINRVFQGLGRKYASVFTKLRTARGRGPATRRTSVRRTPRRR